MLKTSSPTRRVKHLWLLRVTKATQGIRKKNDWFHLDDAKEIESAEEEKLDLISLICGKKPKARQSIEILLHKLDRSNQLHGELLKQDLMGSGNTQWALPMRNALE